MAEDTTAWWDTYGNLLTDEHKQMIRDEHSASSIEQYQSSILPGLLQTEAYARAVSSWLWPAAPTPNEVTARTEARVRRQWHIFEQPNPPRQHYIIDEAALYSQCGGPGILYEQLVHLLTMAKLPYVTVQILPITSGDQWYIYGVPYFAIYSYHNPERLAVAYTDYAPHYAKRIENTIEVDLYRQAFIKLQVSADDPKHSTVRIKHAIKTLDEHVGTYQPLAKKQQQNA